MFKRGKMMTFKPTTPLPVGEFNEFPEPGMQFGRRVMDMGQNSEPLPPFPASPMARQEGGSHYKDMVIQPREYIIANKLGYDEGNVVKYVSRWRAKGGIADLKKAKHYLEMLIADAEKGAA
jgi:hypothetical protein